MLRRILSVLAGMVVAFFCVTLVEAVSARIYPLPAGVDVSDERSLRDAMAHIPTGAILLVLAGWALGSLAGGLTAGRIARALRPALIVGVLLLAVGLLNLRMIPHPVWVWVGGPLLLFVPAWLGGRLAVPRSV
jgi:hypothetical protein